MELHIGYEDVDPYPSPNTGPEVPTPMSTGRCSESATRKCATPESPSPKPGRRWPTTQLIYNQHLTRRHPRTSPRLQTGNPQWHRLDHRPVYIKTDKASGIVNDPNAWADEHNDPATSSTSSVESQLSPPNPGHHRRPTSLLTGMDSAGR